MSKVLNQNVFENSEIEEKNSREKNLKKKKRIKNENPSFFSIFNSVKSPASGKENVGFRDSPDFVNFLDFRTGRDVR